MKDHESALQKALIARLKADATMQALLGDPARIWDEPPTEPVWPHMTVGRSESRPTNADGGAVEHRLSLTCISRFGGTEEARAVAAAARARLHEATLEADGVRTVNLRVTFTDVFRAPDLKRTYAIIRLRAVTEETED
ncbi:MAG: DUF3168 domain-containing protein [Caulobacterales bacterium]|nr:DUF3168 domain-containing protein [Caulobacterales bacterium]